MAKSNKQVVETLLKDFENVSSIKEKCLIADKVIRGGLAEIKYNQYVGKARDIDYFEDSYK